MGAGKWEGQEEEEGQGGVSVRGFLMLTHSSQGNRIEMSERSGMGKESKMVSCHLLAYYKIKR